MKTLICGSSFIQRYRKHLLTFKLQEGEGIEANFSRNFGFKNNNLVYLQGRGGLCLDTYGIGYIKDRVNKCSPELLVLEIGTNDITNKVHPDSLFKTVENLCQELLNATTVKYIVLIKIIERKKTRQCSRPDFDSARYRYNTLIQDLSKKHPSTIYVHKHDRSIIVKLEQNRISRDGIHVTSKEGLRLYHFSIRRAIARAQKKMQLQSTTT